MGGTEARKKQSEDRPVGRPAGLQSFDLSLVRHRLVQLAREAEETLVVPDLPEKCRFLARVVAQYAQGEGGFQDGEVPFDETDDAQA